MRVIRKTQERLSTVTSWSTDQHRKLIAEAFGEEPISAGAALANLEPFLQPELAEAFFCGKLVLVEGIEDRALLTTALVMNGVFPDFVRSGGHIIGTNGKGGFINMIGLARGFETPFFAMFDADTLCAGDERDNNKLLNGKLAKLLGKDETKCTWPTDDFFDSDVIIWKEDIQAAMQRDYGAWYDDVKAVCSALGWSYKRLRKNPAVLSRTLEQVMNAGTKIKSPDTAVATIFKFAVG